MKHLSDEVIRFFQSQGCVVFSSIGEDGFPHSACKDIVKTEKEGRLYLLDAYHGVTIKNLGLNPAASVTAFDEHKFIGYCLKGKAKILSPKELTKETKKAWEDRIASRLTIRVLKNIKDEKLGNRHHEAYLPEPKNVIMLEVVEVVDLSPHTLR